MSLFCFPGSLCNAMLRKHWGRLPDPAKSSHAGSKMAVAKPEIDIQDAWPWSVPCPLFIHFYSRIHSLIHKAVLDCYKCFLFTFCSGSFVACKTRPNTHLIVRDPIIFNIVTTAVTTMNQPLLLLSQQVNTTTANAAVTAVVRSSS